MVEEILNTRLMVKKAMKEHKNDKVWKHKYERNTSIFILTKITKYECNLYQNCLYDYFAKLCTLCYLLNII